MTDDGSASRPQYLPASSAQQNAGGLPPTTGALPYALGFLVFIPVPFVNLLVAGVVMAAVYPSQRRRAGVAAENGRRAANWGLTAIAILIFAIGAAFVMLPLVDGTDLASIAPMPLMIILPLGIAHLVVIIVGLVKAGRAQVFENPLAIPFFRRR